MSNPNQHLPERSYPCRDCGITFETAELFSDHFLREGQIIIGCKTTPLFDNLANKQIERPA